MSIGVSNVPILGRFVRSLSTDSEEMEEQAVGGSVFLNYVCVFFVEEEKEGHPLIRANGSELCTHAGRLYTQAGSSRTVLR
jgi:hypothetical protein